LRALLELVFEDYYGGLAGAPLLDLVETFGLADYFVVSG